MSALLQDQNAAAISVGDRLSFTVFVALALHALLIFGITFVGEEPPALAPTLNITLATHNSRQAPEKADFLAQHNQEASGTREEAQQQTTRTAADIDDLTIKPINLNPQQRRTDITPEQRHIITASQSEFQTTQLIKEKLQREEVRQGEKIDTPFSNPEIASLRAKLDQLQNEHAKRPRIRRLTSVATRASADAAYLNAWAEKIERIGNRHFPQQALEQKIFGQLRLLVVLDNDGSVRSVEILQSSGQRILDSAAKQIVRLASPFPPFPDEIRRTADRLEIIRTWRFDITGVSTSQQP